MEGRDVALAWVIVVAVAWLIVLSGLVLDLTVLRRKGAYLRWLAPGLLLVIGVVLMTEFAQLRAWPRKDVVSLGTIQQPIMLAGVLLVVAGAVVSIRKLLSRARQTG
jgi:hypothetical protein